MKGDVKGGVYQIPYGINTSIKCNKDKVSIALWYSKLGHIYLSLVKYIMLSINKTMKPNNYYELCSACQLCKSQKLAFQNVHVRFLKLFNIVHMD